MKVKVRTWVILGILFLLIGVPLMQLGMGYRHAKQLCGSVSIGESLSLDKWKAQATELGLDFAPRQPKEGEEGLLMFYAHTAPRPAMCLLFYDAALKVTKVEAKIAD